MPRGKNQASRVAQARADLEAAQHALGQERRKRLEAERLLSEALGRVAKLESDGVPQIAVLRRELGRLRSAAEDAHAKSTKDMRRVFELFITGLKNDDGAAAKLFRLPMGDHHELAQLGLSVGDDSYLEFFTKNASRPEAREIRKNLTNANGMNRANGMRMSAGMDTFVP